MMRTQRDWKVPWKRALQWDEHKCIAPQRDKPRANQFLLVLPFRE